VKRKGYLLLLGVGDEGLDAAALELVFLGLLVALGLGAIDAVHDDNDLSEGLL
jgi:hypothetical protein